MFLLFPTYCKTPLAFAGGVFAYILKSKSLLIRLAPVTHSLQSRQHLQSLLQLFAVYPRFLRPQLRQNIIRKMRRFAIATLAVIFIIAGSIRPQIELFNAFFLRNRFYIMQQLATNTALHAQKQAKQ